METHKHGTVLDCGCVFGVSRCYQAAKMFKRFHDAGDSITRAKAASAYNKHLGYEDEPTTGNIKGEFYQNGLLSEHGFDMLKDMRETLDIAMWNKGAAIKYVAWNYTITETQAMEVVEWAIDLMTEKEEEGE